VKQHLENRRNHTFLLMALLICELGQQRWTDFPHSPAISTRR
jgi:hypothetical protein